jgi:hypothetical protein
MIDARWLDIEDDLASSTKHFRNAIAIYQEGLAADDSLPAYKGRMAFMQAMQAGYTSMETAFERMLEVLGETKPTGSRDYHAQLVRVARAIPDERPAIVEGDLVRAIDEARRFRHVAGRGYDDFEAPRAAPPIDAAKIIVEALEPAIATF